MYGCKIFIPKIKIKGDKSIPAIPILKAGTLLLIGYRIFSKYLSKKLFICPIGWSYGT